jgi:beta-N-acetylhexosaminidase
MLATTDLDAAQRLSGEGLVGGVTVLGQLNASLPDQLQAITAASEVAPMLAIDEEGGTVQRLEAILGPYPSASSVANDLDPQAAGAQFMAHAERVGDLGFTMILAPVADVGGGPGIGTRTFGTDPAVVGDYVVSHVQAISDAGLTPVVKHFPGHGRADADSHESLPTAPSLDQLREVDLLPFIEAFDAEAPSVMVGHLSVAGLTNGEPTSLSRAAVTGLLREELGYDGLVMTDSLGMGAVAGTTEEGEAALLAVQAGNDMAMVEREPQTRAAHQLLVAGVADGSLPEAQFNRSVERVLEAKGWPLCTDPEGVTP